MWSKEKSSWLWICHLSFHSLFLFHLLCRETCESMIWWTETEVQRTSASASMCACMCIHSVNWAQLAMPLGGRGEKVCSVLNKILEILSANYGKFRNRKGVSVLHPCPIPHIWNAAALDLVSFSLQMLRKQKPRV